MLTFQRSGSRLPSLIVLLAWTLLAPGYPAAARDRHGLPPQGVDLGPLFQLVSHEGRRLDREKYRRKPFAVVFGFTNCPDVCPTTLLHMTTLLDDIGREAADFPVLFVTVDPERDTVEILRQYVTSFGPRITGLTGSAIEIEAVAHAFNAFYERQAPSGGGYAVDHTTRVFLIDPFGLLADAHDPAKDADKLRETIRKVILQKRR
jgi:protein SCO1/2